MRSKAAWFFGKLLAVLSMIAAAVFMCILLLTGVFPTKYILLGGVVLLVLIVLIAIFTWNTNSKARYAVGVILALLLIAGTTFGSFYIYRTLSYAKKLTGADSEVTDIGVYVKKDNMDSFESAGAGYTYGVLKSLDRTNSDHALNVLADDFGTEVRTSEAASLTELADGLLEDKDQAIILNSAFIPVIEEMKGYENFSEQIKEVKSIPVTEGVSEKPARQISASDPFVMYISGIDTREDQLIAKSRSDVNILAVVNPQTRQLLLVSTPRDYYVPLSISDGVPDKLTHAGIYGVQVSMDTLSMLYDEDIDYYFRVNFTGFEKVIDAMGGVTVNSDYEFDVNDYHFVKGENNLNGAQTLAFARERHAFTDGDRQRGKDQMAVIEGVIKKMSSVQMLDKFDDILAAMEGSFETSLPYDTISELVRSQLTDPTPWTVVRYSVNGTGDNQIPYSMSQSAYVMIPDQSTVDTAKEMIDKVKNGETVEAPPETAQETAASEEELQ